MGIFGGLKWFRWAEFWATNVAHFQNGPISSKVSKFHVTKTCHWPRHLCHPEQPRGKQPCGTPCQLPGGIHISSEVARHVSSQVASKSAAMSHQSTTIHDDFILSQIVSHGLGCMGLGLLRDDSDTSRIATFIKVTSRDLMNDAHSTTKM
jgi:hypothetical protein